MLRYRYNANPAKLINRRASALTKESYEDTLQCATYKPMRPTRKCDSQVLSKKAYVSSKDKKWVCLAKLGGSSSPCLRENKICNTTTCRPRNGHSERQR